MIRLSILQTLMLFLVGVHSIHAITSYQLTIAESNPEIINVKASLALNDQMITMAGGGIPSEITRGWAAFVTINSIITESGKEIAFDWDQDSKSWRLDAHPHQKITLDYQVALAHQQYDWSSVGGKDAGPSLLPGPSIIWVTKGLFIVPGASDFTIRSTESIAVSFLLPKSWKVSTAWLVEDASHDTYRIPGYASLTNNLLMIGRHREVKTQFDNMSITWAVVPELQHRIDLFQKTLAAVLPVYRDVFGELPATNYLICASLNTFEDGEAFQNSFHQMFVDLDLEQRKIVWGNVLAHEMFHYWNGTFFLRAADATAQSWFSEGFTEYYSNLALIRGGVVTQGHFFQKMAFQFSRYFNAKFLNNPQPSLIRAGFQKSKYWSLIYGGGATTAFVLDVLIRSSSDKGASLDQVMRYLYQHYGKKGVLLSQDHITQALEELTGNSYQQFFDHYINGAEVMPLLETCATAGLSVAFYQGEFYLTPSDMKDAILTDIMAPKAPGVE